jgi:hypothetical protein
MGFFKGLTSQVESAKYTVQTRIKIYDRNKQAAPDLEPHQWLLRTYINYFESRRNAFPDKSMDYIKQYGFHETMIFAALPEPNNINALSLYLLQKTVDTDGGLLNAYPNYSDQYNGAMGGIADIYANNKNEFNLLYSKRNPKTAHEYFNEETWRL